MTAYSCCSEIQRVFVLFSCVHHSVNPFSSGGVCHPTAIAPTSCSQQTVRSSTSTSSAAAFCHLVNRRWWRRPGFSSTTQQFHLRVKHIISCMHCRQLNKQDSSQSLCPLLSIEWAYQWKVFNVLNSAVMRLTPRGETVVAMLGMMATKYPWYDFNAEIVTPLLQRSYFPHCLFDPEWETEAFIGFFDQKVDDPDWAQWYIDHAFIYHYHNQ